MKAPANILAISGSTRRISTNTTLLEALAACSTRAATIEVFADLAALPIFNPDDEGNRTPDVVRAFCSKVQAADGLILAVPEYAHGIPGGLKNALDWLVSRTEFPDKALLMVHASNRGAYVRAALSEVLRTMAGRLVSDDGLTIHLLGMTRQDIDAILSEPETVALMQTAIADFVSAIDAFAHS